MTGLSIAFSESPEQHLEPQKPPSNTLIKERPSQPQKDYSSSTPLYNESLLVEEDVALAADAYRICQEKGLTYDQLCRLALRHYIKCQS